MSALHSRLCVGWVRHRRLLPKHHAFHYPVFMSWLDLDELDQIMKQSFFWSRERFNLVSFYRSDYLGDASIELAEAVRQRIRQKTGHDFSGRIVLLTNLRYLGFCFNPVSFYFCYPGRAEQPRYILAEINNTPWDERFCYLLDTRNSPQQSRQWSFEFDKRFHVSPFMPMNLRYHWRFSLHPQAVAIHMSLRQNERRCFDATLQLQPRPMSRRTMRNTPLRYPFMTVAVVLWIYWQAFWLWLKRVPLHDHPERSKATRRTP